MPWLHILPKGGLFLVEKDGDDRSLCLEASYNFSADLKSICANVAFGRCLCGRAAANREVQFADCIDGRHDNRSADMTPHGHYSIPILHGDEIVGVLVCYLPHGHRRVEREQAFLERVANVLSMGIFQRQQSASLQKAQQEANRSADQIHAITRNLSGIIFRRIDYPDGRVEYPYISSSDRKLAHFPSWLLEKGVLEGCEMVHPDDREMVKGVLRPGLKEPKPMAHDFRLVMENGKTHWVHCTAFPTVLESGAVCWDGLLLDIDDRKSLEAQLAQSQKLEAVGQLAAGIAHEINTPTQYVSDNTHFIREAFEDIIHLLGVYREYVLDGESSGVSRADLVGLEDEIDLEYLKKEVPAAIEQAQEGLQSISRIIGAMKQFSHPGTDEMGTVDINKLLQNTVTISRNEWKYVARVDMDLSPEICHVTGYSNQLGQVFLNLIVNAAHAIAGIGGEKREEEGRISISSRMADDSLEIRIADNGPGIPRDMMEKVFNPFFTTKEVGKGTGQGLAIAHDIIVNKHKGSLTLQTMDEPGAEFVIRLPLEQGLCRQGQDSQEEVALA
ncbi:ATP-binding protein [Thiolapillus sp.]